MGEGDGLIAVECPLVRRGEQHRVSREKGGGAVEDVGGRQRRAHDNIVYIKGESGVGPERLKRLIHCDRGGRRKADAVGAVVGERVGVGEEPRGVLSKREAAA